VGCWPSEGAISRGTLEMLEQAGFKWVASSANVLGASLRVAGIADNDDLSAYNRPYTLPGGKLSCFFRDDTLSDRIGFNYSTWHGDDAAQNFAQELATVARNYSGAPGHVMLIALDGENAWEYYPFNGYYFLRALYAALADHPLLELTTLSECVTRGLEPVPLQKVVTGSWVHGTLATWMGDQAKNAAWDLLCDAKQVFDRVMREGAFDDAKRLAVERQLALCESSDWFWWFGDYNPAEAVSQFDRLYRRQLVNLYRLLGVTPPDSLNTPISVGRGLPESGGVMRRASAN
jgi:alpha-amylase/alpha-mannosidase (GH57 family)